MMPVLHVAEGLSGNEAAFAEEMTVRARELGMTKSSFVNSTGWPHPDHYSTARDLSKVARHIIYNLGDYYHYYWPEEFHLEQDQTEQSGIRCCTRTSVPMA